MIEILTKAIRDQGIKQPINYWAEKQAREKNTKDALKKFAQNSNLACVSMPKSGNGTNITVGNVNIHAGVNEISFTLKDTNSYDNTCLSLAFWCFEKLELDVVNSLLIINEKIAISFK